MTVEHVLLTTDVVGGVWDFALTLAAELRRRHAMRVTLLVLGNPSAAHRAQAAHAGAELVAAAVRLEWMQAGDKDIERTAEVVARIARDLRVDVVHANQFGAACANLGEVPVVLTLHSDVLSWRRWTLGARDVPDVPPEWARYSALVRSALARASSVVGVSHFLVDQVRDLYACDRAIEVIHNGWPAGPPVAGEDAPRPPVTLLAGRIWDAAKNVQLAADAAREWPAAEVYLAGEQTHPDGGAQSVSEPLQALGFLERPALESWLRRVRIYLSPARYDPFGLLPLQAALQGCALLLSDIPAYRELWDGAAVFFRVDGPNAADDLRRRWVDLLQDAELSQHLARQANARARQRFSAAAMADAYHACYTAAYSRPVAA